MVKKLDKWCDMDWIFFLCGTATVTGVLAAIFWDDMTLGAQGAIFADVIMAFHVLEEWKCPGGLHYFYNTLLGPKDPKERDLSRFPMSRLTDMVTNVGLQWIPLIYLVLSLIFPSLANATALCMMLFCFIEVAAHTAAGALCLHWYRDAGKKTIYNPGFATAYMMFLPAGIYIAVHLRGITGGDWLRCLILMAIMMAICIPLQETPLKKWVAKQEKGMFSFVTPKYYTKFLSDEQKAEYDSYLGDKKGSNIR